MKREIEFRQQLEKNAVGGLRTPGGPDRQSTEDAGASSAATTPTSE
jgi:hypothetical protein